MVFIKDQNAINEYRKRRSARVDAKNWVEELNLGGIADGVKPTMAEVPKDDVVFARLSKDMRPSREYRFLSDGEIMNRGDWGKANKTALMPIYKMGGSDAIDEEYYKGLLVNSTRGLKRISIDDTCKKIELDDEFRSMPTDDKFRRRMIRCLLSNRESRNAALNLMYENYCSAVGCNRSFEDFLNTPIKLYKLGEGVVYSPFSFIDREGRKEISIRPIDTFGSIQIGPNVLVPNWRIDGEIVRDDDDWGWRKEEKLFFDEKEEEPVEVEVLDSIKREAEMIKLFSDDKTEVGKAVIDRCTDSIHRLLKRLTIIGEQYHTDSAFFEEELNDNIGERDILYPEVQEFRERRKKRLDAKFEENEHPRGKDGKFVSGGGKVGLSESMKPAGTDYDYSITDDVSSFITKNAKSEKLREVYEKGGMEAVEDEWLKVRLHESDKEPREMEWEDAEDEINEIVGEDVVFDWIQDYDHKIKPKLAHFMSWDVRNAALNAMYYNYKDSCRENGEEPLPFKEFLDTPIKMYRGGSKGKEYDKASEFSSYTFSKGIAEHFKREPIGLGSKTDDGVIWETEVRPIDTLGSIDRNGEYEVFVPRWIAPNGRNDEKDDHFLK